MKRVNSAMKMKLQCDKYLELHRIEVALQIKTVYVVCLTIHLRKETEKLGERQSPNDAGVLSRSEDC